MLYNCYNMDWFLSVYLVRKKKTMKNPEPVRKDEANLEINREIDQETPRRKIKVY